MRTARTLLWFLTVAIVVFSLAGIGLAFQNEPEGFRGLKWGDSPTEDMVIDTVEDLRMWCTRDNERLYIGPAEIERIRYVFYKGEFAWVLIEPKHFKEQDLEDVLVLKFGNAEDVSSTWRGHVDYAGVYTRVKDVTYTWLGERTEINFYRQFRFWREGELRSTGRSRLTMSSVQISDEYERDRERKLEEARRKREKAIKKGLADF